MIQRKILLSVLLFISCFLQAQVSEQYVDGILVLSGVANSDLTLVKQESVRLAGEDGSGNKLTLTVNSGIQFSLKATDAISIEPGFDSQGAEYFEASINTKQFCVDASHVNNTVYSVYINDGVSLGEQILSNVSSAEKQCFMPVVNEINNIISIVIEAGEKNEALQMNLITDGNEIIERIELSGQELSRDFYDVNDEDDEIVVSFYNNSERPSSSSISLLIGNDTDGFLPLHSVSQTELPTDCIIKIDGIDQNLFETVAFTIYNEENTEIFPALANPDDVLIWDTEGVLTVGKYSFQLILSDLQSHTTTLKGQFFVK